VFYWERKLFKQEREREKGTGRGRKGKFEEPSSSLTQLSCVGGNMMVGRRVQIFII